MRRVIKVGDSLAVVIPPEYLKAACIERGDFIVFEAVFPDRIVLHRVDDQKLRKITA